MSAGLYSREVVAKLLGKKVEEIERLIVEDGLPAVALPSRKRERPKHKFAASLLLGWLNRRTMNQPWTIEMLIDELNRCVQVESLKKEEAA